ncbi:diguanylate cyclase (GGDEF) domain-containing protein [Bryocella elongata]|uniref:Diguanylate cyclase (GGDEF) domain-containing protein n=1 Tax=Bryocella elongata TaxID=863522 RepID=A0A1H5STU9_9BACT|nr:GGDEF domain-containing protein [Bryocella elongata]SEF53910.1 diguanylate cyclase (GGDEF) domain-containing protein [Bryocella elongata]
MNFLAIPSFLGITWMTFVLARVHDRNDSERLRLWVGGLLLIVLEGLSRILYYQPGMPSLVHRLAHVVALDAYFLAGIVFLRSSAIKKSRYATGRWYLLLIALPHVVLLTIYGLVLPQASLYFACALVGLVGAPLVAVAFRKALPEAIAQALVWAIVLAGLYSSRRLGVYLSLASIYGITAFAFAFRLNRNSRGRWVVAASFAMWSVCFMIHPWIAEHHAAWAPILDQVWDLQRYLVTFGVLIYSLEERVAVNEYAALHDALTGLANRTLFESRLRNALARSRRRQTRVLLLSLDMSGFKQVNDTFGHAAGDALLKQVAQRLGNTTRETDTVARLGGDEFSVILEDVDNGLSSSSRPDAVNVRCEALVRKVRGLIEDTPFVLPTRDGARSAGLQVAVGTAIFPDDADTAEELYVISDESMYRDKTRLRHEESLTSFAI